MMKRTPPRLGLYRLALALSLCVIPQAFAQTKGMIGSRAAISTEMSPAPYATASMAELSDGADAATLTIGLSAAVAASAFVLSEPDRVIVDLPAVGFEIDPQIGKSSKSPSHRAGLPHLVDSYRFGSFAPGRSRIVIDLAGPARVVRTDVAKIPERDGYRLTIQLAKTDRAAFQAAAQAARSAMAAATASEPLDKNAPDPAASAALPRIVIDPGHGGVDSGAMVGSLIEKAIVLEFAKILAAKLTSSGHYTVIMTRSDDSFISLGERVKMARDGNAALFVSIHADTLSETDVTGATVYTVSEKASDSEAAKVAEKENQADAAAGVEGKEEANGVSDILFDLTRRETRAYSHVFAHTLANYWRVAARLNKNPERAAGFKVLTAPDVPSVLLELGYLSNEKDASALNSPDWRDKATSQVAAAIDTFFAGRGPAPSAQTASEAPLFLKPSASPDLGAAGGTLMSEARPAGNPHDAGVTH